LPLIGAVGALENGDQPKIMLLGEAAYLAIKDVADSIQGVGLPPLSRFLGDIVEHGVFMFRLSTRGPRRRRNRVSTQTQQPSGTMAA
jgi:predicted peroxiredoxin